MRVTHPLKSDAVDPLYDARQRRSQVDRPSVKFRGDCMIEKLDRPTGHLYPYQCRKQRCRAF
jgi:hypothetical protein